MFGENRKGGVGWGPLNKTHEFSNLDYFWIFRIRYVWRVLGRTHH
jgi:hypothetical protein